MEKNLQIWFNCISIYPWETTITTSLASLDNIFLTSWHCSHLLVRSYLACPAGLSLVTHLFLDD